MLKTSKSHYNQTHKKSKYKGFSLKVYPHVPYNQRKSSFQNEKKVLVNCNNMKIKFPSIGYDLYYNYQIPKCIYTDEQVKKILCLLVKSYF